MTNKKSETTYKPEDMVLTKHADGTLVSTTYKSYQEGNDGSVELVGPYEMVVDARTLELEKLLNDND